MSEVQRVTNAKPGTNSKYILDATVVPSPNPEFEAYGLVVAPSFGLCKIDAIGKTVRDDAYGSELRAHFKRIAEALETKYGKVTSEYDFLNAGSIWDEGRDWMMGLTKNERTFASFWGGVDATGPLTPPIKAIALQAQGLSSSSGYLTLSYEFQNATKCLEEVRALMNSSL